MVEKGLKDLHVQARREMSKCLNYRLYNLSINVKGILLTYPEVQGYPFLHLDV